MHPAYAGYLLIYGVMSVAGVLCVFATVVTFGSLVNSIVTTTRKFVSILFSIYMFGHSCSVLQYGAIFAIFVTVCYNFYVDNFAEKTPRDGEKQRHAA